MFRLRKQVGGNVARVRRSVGDDEDFTRPGEEVAAYLAEEPALCLDDKRVSGAEKLVDGLDCLRTDTHCGNRLRPADFADFFDVQKTERAKDVRIYGAVARGRRADADFGAARNLRKRNGHYDRRNERRTATGDVNADAVYGIEIFADCRTVRILRAPILGLCMQMVRLDRRDCLAHCLFVGRGNEFRGGFHFGFGNGGVGDVRAVEFFRKLAHGGVSATAHGGYDRIDSRNDFGRKGDRLARLFQIFGKRGRLVV